MADVFTKLERSLIMAKVKGKDTKPEILVRSIVHKLGFRFRKTKYDLPGNPDVVLPKYKTAIFVHGCFWHQHSKCRGRRIPKSNVEYWLRKLQRNIARDRAAQRKLRTMGWKVIIVWECQARNPAQAEKVLGKPLSSLKIRS